MKYIKHILIILTVLILTGCCCSPWGNPLSKPDNDDKSTNEQMFPLKMIKMQREYQELLLKYEQAKGNPNISDEELDKMKDELTQKEEELNNAREQLKNSKDPMLKKIFNNMDDPNNSIDNAEEKEFKNIPDNHPGVGLSESELENAMQRFSERANNEESQPYNEFKDSNFDVNDEF